jgi:hypothetical protein
VWHGVHLDAPNEPKVLRGVTALAVGANLTAVDVEVAAGALVRRHIRRVEPEVDVATATLGLVMPAGQRKRGLSIVAEVELVAKRAPAGGGVAGLACDGDVAVWVIGLRLVDRGP